MRTMSKLAFSHLNKSKKLVLAIPKTPVRP